MRITGTGLDDTLNGTDRRDLIDGRAGDDLMIGGLDHDTYYVDSVLDYILEALGEGTDWVYTTTTYTLTDNVEHMKLLGNSMSNLYGNNWDNTLIGNNANNILDGGAGADVMIGGRGNDTYYLNQFSTNGINNQKGVHDVIVDTGGIDTAVCVFNSPGFSDLKYIMQNGLENVNFTGSETTMTVTGNAGKNYIVTGDLDDVIDGGRGADTMDGGLGKNTFYVDHRLDVIIDSFADYDGSNEPDEATADTAIIKTSRYDFDPAVNIEYITFAERGVTQVTGSDSKNIITGNAFGNKIYGAGGDDTIDGGGGNDMLYGGAGADTFVFSADVFTDSGKKPVAVRIMDFNIAQGDVLDISDIISYDSGTIISSYVDITDRGRDSMVRINTSADGEPAHWIHVATLVGINGLTGEGALFDNGNLILASS